MKLPKWLTVTLTVLTTVLHILGGAGIIPPVVRLNDASVQPMIGKTNVVPVTNPAPVTTPELESKAR